MLAVAILAMYSPCSRSGSDGAERGVEDGLDRVAGSGASHCNVRRPAGRTAFFVPVVIDPGACCAAASLEAQRRESMRRTAWRTENSDAAIASVLTSSISGTSVSTPPAPSTARCARPCAGYSPDVVELSRESPIESRLRTGIMRGSHMPLQAGTRLGPYEVLSLIGAGGMGEVYRARDTKLARDVALKILRSAITDDPTRLARFDARGAGARLAQSPAHWRNLRPRGVRQVSTRLSSNWLRATTLADRSRGDRCPSLRCCRSRRKSRKRSRRRTSRGSSIAI